MTEIHFKEHTHSYATALGISKERENELRYQFDLVAHELRAPMKPGEKERGTDFFLQHHLLIGENEQERAFSIFYGGIATKIAIDEYVEAGGGLESVRSHSGQDDDEGCGDPNCISCKIRSELEALKKNKKGDPVDLFAILAQLSQLKK